MTQIALDEIQLSIQPLLAPANINPSSFLATDYLNHFNEIVMMLEMVPDMPDMMDDILDWEPKSYQQHFKDSGFDASELAIEAFEMSPEPLKSQFLSIVKELNDLLSGTLFGLQKVNVIERGFSDAARALVVMRVKGSQALLGRLNGIIHGVPDTQLLGNQTVPTAKPDIKIATNEPEAQEEVQSQADIDALFD